MATKRPLHHLRQLDAVLTWVINTKVHLDLARRLAADRVRYPRGGESNNQLRLWGIEGESLITRVINEINPTLDKEQQITADKRPRIEDLLDCLPDVP